MTDSTGTVVTTEGSGGIESLGEQDDVRLTVDRLSPGDYLVDDWLRVERKTPTGRHFLPGKAPSALRIVIETLPYSSTIISPAAARGSESRIRSIWRFK